MGCAWALGGMDVAGQLAKIIALLNDHPWGFAVAVITILLVLGFQKDGLFSRYVGYREAKENRQTALEQRRLEIIYMLENRAEPEFPALTADKVKTL